MSQKKKCSVHLLNQELFLYELIFCFPVIKQCLTNQRLIMQNQFAYKICLVDKKEYKVQYATSKAINFFTL